MDGRRAKRARDFPAVRLAVAQFTIYALLVVVVLELPGAEPAHRSVAYACAGFALIAPAIGGAALRALCERVVAAVREATNGLGPDGRSVHLGASAGTAMAPDDAETIHDLLEAADHALRAAKRKGKDRVVGAAEEEVALLAQLVAGRRNLDERQVPAVTGRRGVIDRHRRSG